MMRFKHSHRGGTSFALFPRGGAALLIATLAGGCSAEITRFDFPGFSLTDDKKETQTASLQSSNAGRGPSYLGNEGGYNSPGGNDRGGYTAPRSLRDSTVASTNLPDSTPAYGNDRGYASDRGAQPQPSYRPAPTARPGESVEVQPGDTLYGLSRRHGVSVSELMEVNGLSNPSLHPGQKLYLPVGYPAQPSASRPMTTASVTPASPPSSPSHSPQSLAPAVAAKYAGSYTVRSGDSIYGIARSHGVQVAELQRVNGITDPRGVRVGSVLKVPGAGYAEAAPEPTTHVAVAAPIVQSTEQAAGVQSSGPSPRQPTVINRRELAAMGSSDVSTGTINPPPRAAVGDKLRWPVQGKILAGFGQRSDGTHNDGINLSVPQGTPVHVAESGTVAYAGSELKGYGNLVLVRHDNGWVTAYAHNDQLLVKRGDKVQRGQVIAKAGRTGSVDQPQLHFELRQGSKPVDPVPFMERL